MVSIARKNLFHDKARLVTSLIALSVSFFMIFFALGMALGTVQGMVIIIDKTTADIWIFNEGNEHFHSPSPFIIDERFSDDIKNIEGVESCNPLIYTDVMVANQKKNLRVKIVGCNVSNGFAIPWEMVDGEIEDLSQNNSVIIDKSLLISLGDLAVNDEIEISGKSHSR